MHSRSISCASSAPRSVVRVAGVVAVLAAVAALGGCSSTGHPHASGGVSGANSPAASASWDPDGSPDSLPVAVRAKAANAVNENLRRCLAAAHTAVTPCHIEVNPAVADASDTGTWELTQATPVGAVNMSPGPRPGTATVDYVIEAVFHDDKYAQSSGPITAVVVCKSSLGAVRAVVDLSTYKVQTACR